MHRDRFVVKPGVLSPHDRVFVTEYLKDWNRTRTMIRLGFKGPMDRAAREGARTLARPEIRGEIDRRINIRAAHVELSAEHVIERYKEIAESNLYDAIAYDDNGEARLELGKLTRAQMAGIQSVEISKKGDIRIKMHDKLEALDKLGDRLGMWRRENQNPVASVRFIIEDSPRQRRIAGEVTVGRVSDQSQVTREIEHEELVVEGARAP